MHNLCTLRRYFKVGHAISTSKLSLLVTFMAPVTTLAVSIWRLSRKSHSVAEKPSQTASAYSITGRIRDLYSVSSVLRSSLNLRVLSRFNFFEAFWCIFKMCDLHERLLVNVKPKWSCEITSSTASRQEKLGMRRFKSLGWDTHALSFGSIHCHKPLVGPCRDGT